MVGVGFMPVARDYLVQLEDVTFSYPGGGTVIRNFNAGLRRGEIVALIGPNGSGKSTLAGLVAGLLVPQTGRVLVDGMDTADASALLEIRRRVGLVIQNPENQVVAARVEEDVAFGPENLNLPQAEVRRRVKYALEAVGLQHLRDKPPHMLSGGEKQRLAIAGLLALLPRCMVLDEPTAMLDPPGRREVMRVLRDLSAGGTAVLLVTHHMDEAAGADRVLVLGQNGTLLEDNNPGVVFYRRELLRRLGLAAPPVFELARLLEDKGFKMPPGGITSKEDLVQFICHALK